METSDALIRIGLIVLCITIIIAAVFVVPHYIAQFVPPIIQVTIVFFILLVAFFVVSKAIKEDAREDPG
jgi:hypothetical protein